MIPIGLIKMSKSEELLLQMRGLIQAENYVNAHRNSE
jgi:hypothetical protein